MKLGRETPCKKRCCWTPLNVCARAGNCACHNKALAERKR